MTFKQIAWHIVSPSCSVVKYLGKPEPQDWNAIECRIKLQEQYDFFYVFLEPLPMFYLSQENKCEHHLYPFNFVFLASIPKGL